MQNNIENTIVNYTIGTLINEKPEMSCSDFIEIFLKDGVFGDRDEEHYSINLEDKYRKVFLETTQSIKSGDILYYTVRQVDQDGGEGQGEFYREVFEFTYADGKSEFIAVEGRYDSWDDTDYDIYEPKVVQPVQRLVTFWE